MMFSYQRMQETPQPEMYLFDRLVRSCYNRYGMAAGAMEWHQVLHALYHLQDPVFEATLVTAASNAIGRTPDQILQESEQQILADAYMRVQQDGGYLAQLPITLTPTGLFVHHPAESAGIVTPREMSEMTIRYCIAILYEYFSAPAQTRQALRAVERLAPTQAWAPRDTA